MRSAIVSRETKETKIKIELNLDGGAVCIASGVGFFDHMLTALAAHGDFGLQLVCKGDLEVDAHHSVEDCGIVLGQAFAKALGNKGGIARYGDVFIPMDESLAHAVLDISGRPFFVFRAAFSQEKIGDFDTCLCAEFFQAFAIHAGITLHLFLESGSNAHHEAEALFKALAHALRQAVAPREQTLSTKGVIES
jgi:imidazoleglycerol-phosphate dehydratase